MKQQQTYRLAYSSCPNDTFIFKAVACGLIDTHEYGFDIEIEDVETLNQRAADSCYDITKLSFAALGNLLDRYALLRTGAALGMGCGPLVISTPGRSVSDSEKPIIAVPGMGTTAYYLFQLYMADQFPSLETEIIAMPFEQIMPAVIEKKADFGVIIHEGRFVYQSAGLELQADLGQWWEKSTALPIPLGCIAVRRDMDPAAACDIQALIRQSIKHAFKNPGAADAYIRSHAQEMEEAVIRQHIELYVNDFSEDLGPKGEAAITTFFARAAEAGLTAGAQPGVDLFAC